MLGSALYYPNIDIHDPAWLRSALLLWEKVYTIVPRAIRSPYNNQDTQICAKEGCLSPLYCDDYPDVIKRLGARTLEILEPKTSPLPFTENLAKAEPNLMELLAAFRSGTRSKMHRDKFGYSLLHPDKVSAELHDIFQEAEASGAYDWFLVNHTFGDIYMGALALLLAEEKGYLSPVTSSGVDHGSTVIALLADSPSVAEVQKGALVSLTMKNLRIDPKTRIDELISFKRRRQGQLIDLAAKLDDLKMKIQNVSDLKELNEQAKKVYEVEIEKGFSDLRSELRASSIQSAWEGIYRGVFFTLPAQSLLGGVEQLLPGAISAAAHSIVVGAGALLTITDVAVRTYFARRKARNSSPFTYLLDAQRKFGLPSESSALQLVQEYQQRFAQ
jgi:hypothetical protein